MLKETQNLSEVEENDKVEVEENSKGSVTYESMMDKLDELEQTNDRLVKTSRLRGFTEGCIVTLGGLTLGGLAISIVNTIKDKK